MATIQKHTNANGNSVYVVMIRRKGVPYFSLRFTTLEEATAWVNENEQKYIENPDSYLKNKEEMRVKMRREREFKFHE